MGREGKEKHEKKEGRNTGRGEGRKEKGGRTGKIGVTRRSTGR